MEYVVREGFVVVLEGEVYGGGERVELTDELYVKYRHRLEGSSRAESIEFEVDFFDDVDSISYPAPYVASVSPARVLEGATVSISVFGSFFTPNTTVEIDSATIIDVAFVNSHLLIVSAFFSEIGSLNLSLDNGTITVTENALLVKSFADSVIDLRSGGTPWGDSAIEIRDGMEWTRDGDGLYFSGSNPFSSWARLVGDDDAWVWNRSQKRSLSIIFRNNSRFMLGIGSRRNNIGSSQQYSQAEIVGYFSSSNIFDGLYGNTGTPGQGINFPYREIVTPTATKKIVFENNGEPDSIVRIYELPSADISDWSDTSNLKGEFIVNDFFGANEPEIMPFLIPRTGKSSLFLGMILL